MEDADDLGKGTVPCRTRCTSRETEDVLNDLLDSSAEDELRRRERKGDCCRRVEDREEEAGRRAAIVRTKREDAIKNGGY